MTQKELKEKYKEIVKAFCTKEDGSFDKSWYDYHVKEAYVLGTLEDGTLFIINRPSLEKRFCFDDSFDFDGAQEMARHAKTDQDYFKTENMKQLEGQLANFQNLGPFEKAVRQPSYLSDQLTDVFTRYDQFGDFSDDTLLSEADIQRIIKAYELALQKQEKRVNTYLKRYGMEHVHSWTYWGQR